ncbi:hypothetical protein OOZ15_05390 [Galbibacter sp. EGI 63066]|uniref:hypothetical protein n=1 Tax=Galbibacter sp. EGI 63066 TaxID=2993559 RepID=UPI002248D6CA|nr:hypothetical protein [Galbibacter sp. EGI 63066]MCX2679370.1 hypothetical protein [Galbibacter sp. EGI 63066]
MKKAKYLYICVLMTFNVVLGQSYELPKIIPPSPESQKFIEFIDFPNQLSLGIPSMNIPIYNIEYKDISFPISLSYSYSGLKPNEDVSGFVGLGWSLNAFGLIARSINDEADEKFWNFNIPLEAEISSNNNNLEQDDDALVLDQIALGHKDSSLDLFSFVLPNGKSGKFVFGRNQQLSEFLKPKLLPYQPVKIIPTFSDNKFQYFDILDESGTLYRFGKSFNGIDTAYEDYSNISTSTFPLGRTSWLLMEIISKNKRDTIHFKYEDVIVRADGLKYFKKHNVQFSKSITSVGGAHTISSTVNHNVYYYTKKRIRSIEFKSGHIQFNYLYDYPECLLKDIKIYQKSNANPIRTIKFDLSKFANVEANRKNWYKLDELSFLDSKNKEISKYSFEYENGRFPYIENEPFNSNAQNSFEIDFWGYYNGEWNEDLLPDFFWAPYVANIFGDADRSPNYNYAKLGVLNKIVFPSGGERIYEYEGNDDYTAGIRVKSIINRTGNNDLKRTYQYSDPYYRLNSDVYYQSHFMNAYDRTTDPVSNTMTASSSSNCDVGINGSPIIYGKVTEFIGDETSSNGIIEHYFDTSFIDRRRSDQWSISKGYPWQHSEIQFLPKFYYDKTFGSTFENKTVYLNTDLDTLKIVNNYYSHNANMVARGLDVSKVVKNNANVKLKAYFFTFYNIEFNQLHQRLDSTKVVSYYDSGNLITRGQYEYNNHLFLKKKQIQTSLGEHLREDYFYPEDYSTAPYTAMVSRNILSPVIEKKNYNIENGESNEVLLELSKTIYKDWGSNRILPEKVLTSKGSGPIEPRIEYKRYDSYGNPEEMQQANGSSVVYLWGYNGQYPIAKIANVTSYGSIPSSLITAAKNASNTGSESSLTSALEDIRDAMPNAQVTTYTYDPLVGVSTITDSKGYTTYYEYDDFNRLEFVKNDAGELLSENKYHYKDQN